MALINRCKVLIGAARTRSPAAIAMGAALPVAISPAGSVTDKRYKQENLPDTKVGGFSQVGRSERWVGGSFGKLAIKLAVFFPVETPEDT